MDDNNGVEEEEEEDADFNPSVREDLSSEASSSVTSEKEDACADSPINFVADLIVQPDSLSCIPGDTLPKDTPHAAKEDEDEQHNVNCDTRVHPATYENPSGRKGDLLEDELQDNVTCLSNAIDSQNTVREANEDDAICKRTRARYSLANYSLEELEAFLQESSDEANVHNVDEEEEYRKFLAAVLLEGGDNVQAAVGDENVDEDENDADFEIEIEEALESDGDENIDGAEAIERPQTRQRRIQKGTCEELRNSSAQLKSHLRPLVPYDRYLQSVPSSLLQYPLQQGHPALLPYMPGANYVNPFAAQQIGQLYVLIHEHVQLLIQIYSLSALDLAKQQVATKTMTMIMEMVSKCEEALSRKNVPYPTTCFQDMYLCPTLGVTCKQNLQYLWKPLIDSPVISVLDVAPVRLARSYVTDVMRIARRQKQSHLDGEMHKDFSLKEPLFLFPKVGTIDSKTNLSTEVNSGSSTLGKLPDQKQLKRTLAANVLECPWKSIALVPHVIARSAEIFFPLFNLALFPHMPPVAAVANRVLFTDAEDGLLAMGLRECNSDWSSIQRRFLPCKTKHQIFIRQKNCSSGKAPENPIKAVRRMKNSPLTECELSLIREGLKLFKHDWLSVWKFFVPHRDPSLLPRQWRTALGIQKSYSNNETTKEKRRLYEAKRRKLKSSEAGAQAMAMQEVGIDSHACDDDEHNEEAYVHEAFLADAETRKPAGKSYGAAHSSSLVSHMQPAGIMSQMDVYSGHKYGSMDQDCISTKEDRLSGERGDPIGSNKIDVADKACLQYLHDGLSPSASQKCTTSSSRVVKLAPGLPPVNLPPSVRVISKSAFQVHKGILPPGNKRDDNISKVPTSVPHQAFQENPCTGVSQRRSNIYLGSRIQVNLHRNEGVNGNLMEENSSDLFQMHPLLFRSSQEEHTLYNYADSSINALQNHVLPSCRQDEAKGSADTNFASINTETPVNNNTIDFHPMLQRLDCADRDGPLLSSVIHSNGKGAALPSTGDLPCDLNGEYPLGKYISDHLHSTTQKSDSHHYKKGPYADFDINLCPDPGCSNDQYDMRQRIGHNSDTHVSKEERIVDSGILARKLIDNSVVADKESNVSFHEIGVFCDDSMQGIVMEQEELSDSEENEDVEFECEEMEDSDDEFEVVQPSNVQNKGGVVQKNVKSAQAKSRLRKPKRSKSGSSNQNALSRGDEPNKAKSRRAKHQQAGTAQASTEQGRAASRKSKKNLL